MARTPRQRLQQIDPANQAEVTIAQAQNMIEIYAEILAMDVKIMERIRQLVVQQSDNGSREAVLVNLRLMLAQMEKIGRRIAYWNSRVRKLVKTQLT